METGRGGFILMQAFAYTYFLIYLLFHELLTINANFFNSGVNLCKLVEGGTYTNRGRGSV